MKWRKNVFIYQLSPLTSVYILPNVQKMYIKKGFKSSCWRNDPTNLSKQKLNLNDVAEASFFILSDEGMIKAKILWYK